MKKLSILLLLISPFSLFAQDSEDLYELSPFQIVENSGLPAVTLRKKADNLLLTISLINDSRDKELREEEILNTLKKMIQDSQKSDNLVILSERKSISIDNVNEVEIYSAYGKADTSACSLLLKIPLKEEENAQEKIEALQDFADNIKEEGRTIVESGAIGLSIENPQLFRNKIITLIAEDYKFILNTFDEKFQILVHNLNQRVKWQRASISELDLYIDYEYEILAPDTQSLKVKTVEEDY